MEAEKRFTVHRNGTGRLCTMESASAHAVRLPTAARQKQRIQELHAQGVSKAQIARQLGIGRTTVRRLLGARDEMART